MNKQKDINDFEVYNQTNNENSEYYNESGFSDYKSTGSTMKLIIVGIIVIVVLVIILIVLKYLNGTPKLKTLDLSVADVLYLNEESKVSASVTGSGKIKNTTYKITVDNDNLDLEKENLAGTSVSTAVMPNKLGKATIKVSATAGKANISKEKDVYICNRLSVRTLNLNDVEIALNYTYVIDIDLGNYEQCYSNIEYSSSDSDIASVDEYGTIVARSAGEATITVSDRDNEFQINVVVK